MGGKDSGVHLGPQGDGGGGAGPGYRNGSGPGGKLQGGGHRGTLVDGRQEIAGEGVPGGGGIHRLDPVGGLEDRLALAVRIHGPGLAQGQHQLAAGIAAMQRLANALGLLLPGEQPAFHLVEDQPIHKGIDPGVQGRAGAGGGIEHHLKPRFMALFQAVGQAAGL